MLNIIKGIRDVKEQLLTVPRGELVLGRTIIVFYGSPEGTRSQTFGVTQFSRSDKSSHDLDLFILLAHDNNGDIKM